MSNYETYQRTGTIEARPYEDGESLEGVSVSNGDEPDEDGYICRDPENPGDRWYVNGEYFERQYQEKGRSITPEMVNSVLEDRVDQSIKIGSKSLVVCVTLQNGYDVVGVAQPVRPDDFQREVGKSVAWDKIRDQVAEVLAYQMHGPIEIGRAHV